MTRHAPKLEFTFTSEWLGKVRILSLVFPSIIPENYSCQIINLSVSARRYAVITIWNLLSLRGGGEGAGG